MMNKIVEKYDIELLMNSKLSLPVYELLFYWYLVFQNLIVYLYQSIILSLNFSVFNHYSTKFLDLILGLRRTERNRNKILIVSINTIHSSINRPPQLS